MLPLGLQREHSVKPRSRGRVLAADTGSSAPRLWHGGRKHPTRRERPKKGGRGPPRAPQVPISNGGQGQPPGQAEPRLQEPGEVTEGSLDGLLIMGFQLETNYSQETLRNTPVCSHERHKAALPTRGVGSARKGLPSPITVSATKSPQSHYCVGQLGTPSLTTRLATKNPLVLLPCRPRKAPPSLTTGSARTDPQPEPVTSHTALR